MPQMDVFISGDPEEFDLFSMYSVMSWPEHQIHKWKCTPSDVDGCKCWHSPVVAEPVAGSIGSNVAPVLTLMDNLRSVGFREVNTLVTHEFDSVLQSDARHATSKPDYFVALLKRTDVSNRGHLSIRSDQPQVYYRLLVAADGPISTGLKAF